MARQTVVIDLTESDERHQDKVNKLEATVASLEKTLDSLTELVIALMDARNPVRNVPSPGPSAPVAPIYTVAPPTMQVAPAFKCDAQQFPNLHAFLLEKEFGGSSKMSNEKSNGKGLPNAKDSNGTMIDENALLSQVSLGEAEAEHVDVFDSADPPMYDGKGNPRDHLKAYLGWVARYGPSNETKLMMFARTLKEPALTWFAIRGPWKLDNWDKLARDFVTHYEFSNPILAQGSPLKRKSAELQVEPVAITDKRMCGLVEAQSKDKGKAVMPSPLPPIAEKPYNIEKVVVNPGFQSSSHKASAVAFTPIPGSYANLFERLLKVGLVYLAKPKPCWSRKPENLRKFCTYHSGMEGHNIEECTLFKKKVESLIKSGHVKILPTNGIGKPFVLILPYAKENPSKKGI